jgi:hypothetical protein
MNSRKQWNVKDDPQGKFNFDLDKGRERRDQGIALATASLSRQQLLALAKVYAVRVARLCGSVTADDVFYEMLKAGLDPTALGPAWGSVFRGESFVFTGRWEKSKRVSNHASDLRVWRLNEDYIPPPSQRMAPKPNCPKGEERNVAS